MLAYNFRPHNFFPLGLFFGFGSDLGTYIEGAHMHALGYRALAEWTLAHTAVPATWVDSLCPSIMHKDARRYHANHLTVCFQTTTKQYIWSTDWQHLCGDQSISR